MIKINYQKKSNDCGVCVLQTLIKELHKKNIEYSELISNFPFIDDGISLFDLENVGLKYGLILESYESNIKELKEYNKTKFFILLIKNNEMLHYVVASKNKNHLNIYCSDRGYYQINYDDFQKIWTGIIIECYKTKFKLNDIKTKNIFSNINWLYVLSNNFLNLILTIFTIFSAQFLQFYLNLIINNNNLSNLLSIILIFLLVNIVKIIGDKCIEIFNFYHTYKHYLWLNKLTINKLKQKYYSFYQKIDINNLRNIDQHLFNISTFYNTTLNKFITDILFLIISSILLLSIASYFNLIIIVLMLIQTTCDIIQYIYNKHKYPKFESTKNYYINNYINFVNQNKSTLNIDYTNNILNNIEKSKLNIRTLIFESLKFNSYIEIMSNILSQIIYMIIYIIAAYYIVEIKTLSFANLTFYITLIQLMLSHNKSLIFSIKQFNPFKYSFEILKIIIDVDNNTNNFGIMFISNLVSIKHKNFILKNDTLIKGKSGSGKTTLLLNICNMRNDILDISYNDINKNNIHQQYFSKNFIYLSNNSIFDEKNIIELLQNEYYQPTISYYLNLLNIKDFKNLSLGQKQSLIFISLISYKNKIILIDELLSNVNSNLKIELLKYIKPMINENNFLIFVSHDDKIDNFFNGVINYE